MSEANIPKGDAQTSAQHDEVVQTEFASGWLRKIKSLNIPIYGTAIILILLLILEILKVLQQ